jgi:hypothetical protein
VRTTENDRRCAWCDDLLQQRVGEPRSAFLRRRHCSRSCQVCTQNSQRAREARRRADVDR